MAFQPPMSIVEDEPDGQQGDADEERIAKRLGSRGQKAESRAWIQDVDNCEEIWDEGGTVAEGNRRLNEQLGGLIQYDDGQSDSIETHWLVRSAGGKLRRAGREDHVGVTKTSISDAPLIEESVVPVHAEGKRSFWAVRFQRLEEGADSIGD